MRLSATTSLMSRKDVIVVASVSCIYNLGSPQDYQNMLVILEKGQFLQRDELIAKLVQIQYERNDYEFIRAKFRVRGDVIEIFPSYSQQALRIELTGDLINKISVIDPVSAKTLSDVDKIAIYPAKHFIASAVRIDAAIKSIREELAQELAKLKKENKLLQAQRLQSRTNYDLEMLKEIGYCE